MFCWGFGPNSWIFNCCLERFEMNINMSQVMLDVAYDELQIEVLQERVAAYDARIWLRLITAEAYEHGDIDYFDMYEARQEAHESVLATFE